MPGTAAALAVLPIAAILVLMLVARWSAARAGLAGLALAAVLAPTAFGFGGAAPRETAQAFAGVLAEAAFTTATILWILWPALALHHHQRSCGALDDLRVGLGRLTRRTDQQVLLVGWFLALFLEGAAGFGTPVALTAPILVGLGVAPVQAVVLALLGHAVGVSFGALGTPVLAQAALTGLDPVALAWRTAGLHALLGAIMMFSFHRAFGAARGAAWPAAAAAAFLVPSLVLAVLLGPELATLGAAVLGAALFALALRLAPRRAVPGAEPQERPAVGAARILARAFWPYAVLILLVVLTRTVPTVAAPLGALAVEWRWLDRFSGRFVPFTHPGTLLFAALLLGAVLQGVAPSRLGGALADGARRLAPVTMALLAMLALSRLMVHAGMIDAIREAAVRGVGQGWPLVAPAVGALGSFVTGSATASNVLFTTLQTQTAQALGLPALAIGAAQGFGAAVGNIVCPHNIVAGAATVGLAGREGEILRRTLLPCLAYLLAGGLTVYALLALAPPWLG
ncbi:L-lactate permease [Ramlibacter sp. AN1015]|uniref:L-lactate permease n=1 Tax=Ramlibacter sp. AN1015 TaxID=3133428 RepID=UPI0030C4CD30